MKTTTKVIGGLAAVLAVLAFASCNMSSPPSDQVVAAVKELKGIVPAVGAGMSVVAPDDPTSRAFDPSNNPPTDWPYGTDSPATVYAAAGGTTGTVRLPASGYYHMDNLDQIYFTMTPEPTIGANYYRVVLYTYPALDLSVAYTIEEYIVNTIGSESWNWGNLSQTRRPNSYVSLTTVYTDGTTGARTLVWNSAQTPGTYYSTTGFQLVDPDPDTASTFDGYHYENSTSALPMTGSGIDYSSHVTETVKGKGNWIDSVQYYTETTGAEDRYGVTYLAKDKKRKWSDDTYVVTRSHENETAKTKTIRSVGQVGATQYYIDRVDISVSGGKVAYTSTHDVYDTALPRGGDPKAKDYVAIDVLEDDVDAGTYTGTLTETSGDQEIVRDVKINRDSSNKPQLSLKFKSSNGRPKALTNDILIPLTKQALSSFSLALPSVNGTFAGYYEAGALFGTLTVGSRIWDVVIADEGVAFDDVLYPY